MLDFGEQLFDRIEIGRVGRQEGQPRISGQDCFSHSPGLVTGEIVDDDDVAGFQRGDEHLLDIGEEQLAVDRAVDDAGRSQAVATQSGEERHCPPAAIRGVSFEPLAPRPPASERRHVGLDPGLVNKHQAGRIEPGLNIAPAAAAAQDVRTRLFGREQAFF